MHRKDFIKICGILGVGSPVCSHLVSCTKDGISESKFTGKVLIIGAGAGGLSSGYLLHQYGIDFEILEASSIYGGRMKINTNFADFPIPLGAEWLETDSGVFHKIVNNASISVNIETISDHPDRKFVNYSWYNFFEEYIVPSISNRISYSTIVQSIDYSGNQVIIGTNIGQKIADKVIVAVPLQVLKDTDIQFIPELPQDKLKAISNSTVWEGFKAFFEFSEKFYQGEREFPVTPSNAGQKIYYDAAFGQNTSMNILGLFVVGTPSLDYIRLSGDHLKNFILEELDDIYSKQATRYYVKHIFQNWNNEPFIKGGYLTDHADWRMVRELSRSISSKVYFAGGEFTDGEDWVSVHTAAQSAKRVMEEILN